jgi:putative transcriptional regulator
MFYLHLTDIYFIMELINNLKSMRFNAGQVTQDELATAVEVSRQTIIAIEKGKFNPSVRLALMIAAHFNCRVEDIFTLKEKGDLS